VEQLHKWDLQLGHDPWNWNYYHKAISRLAWYLEKSETPAMWKIERKKKIRHDTACH